MIFYANYLITYGSSRFQVQQRMAILRLISIELGLTVNLTKTVVMKFNRGRWMAFQRTLFS